MKRIVCKKPYITLALLAAFLVISSCSQPTIQKQSAPSTLPLAKPQELILDIVSIKATFSDESGEYQATTTLQKNRQFSLKMPKYRGDTKGDYRHKIEARHIVVTPTDARAAVKINKSSEGFEIVLSYAEKKAVYSLILLLNDSTDFSATPETPPVEIKPLSTNAVLKNIRIGESHTMPAGSFNASQIALNRKSLEHLSAEHIYFQTEDSHATVLCAVGDLQKNIGERTLTRTLTVQVTAEDRESRQNYTFDCVYAYPPARLTELRIEPSFADISRDQTIELGIVADFLHDIDVEGAKAGFNNVEGSWKSLNPDVAAVSDKGTVTALNEGIAFIEFQLSDGSKKAEAQINVYAGTERGGGFFARGVSRTDGWFDVNKSRRLSPAGNNDSKLCWAAAASNLLDWWQAGFDETTLASLGVPHGQDSLTGNPNKVQSRVFQLFKDTAVNGGHDIDKGINWYITSADAITQSQPGANPGGYYKKYFGNDTKVAIAYRWGREGFKSEADFTRIIREAFSQGYGVGIGWSGGTTGHAITCWGYELGGDKPDRNADTISPEDAAERESFFAKYYMVTDDDIKSRNGNSRITHLYMTDSDDAMKSPELGDVEISERDRSLFRAPIYFRGGDIRIGATRDASLQQLDIVVVFKLRQGELAASKK